MLDIPDYPPPTFQEAISSLALQIPVTTTDVDAHEDENHRSNDQAVQQRASAFDSDSSSSDSSHDFCDIRSDETPPATPPKRAKANHHGLAFPSTPLRGRNKSRTVLDDDAEGGSVTTQPVAATRRHNSLSPLRIFPSLHLTIHDRAASAHPTTEHASSSPYQHSRGMSSFFRSTTSLALLNGNGNTTPITLRSKSSMSNLSSNTVSPKRKLFSPSKGKERAERSDRLDKVEIDPETDQLESWEVIDATEAVEVDTLFESKKSKDKKEGRRKSPDRMVETPVEASRSHAEATPAAPISTLETPVQQLHPPVPVPIQPQQPSIHPLSVRDRKAPIPPIERPQRPSPQPVPPRPNSPPAIAPAASRVAQSHDSPSKPGSGPPITTVRVARRQTTGATPTLSTKRSQVFNSSPLGIQTWKPGEESPTKVVGDTAVGSEVDPSLQTALETPLPPSPIGSIGSRLHLSASTMTSTGFSSEFQSFMAEIAGLQFTPSTDSFSMAADTLGFAGGTETPTKKHYHGRPLPPAPSPASPAVRHPIDSVYLTPSSPPAGEVGREEKDKGKGSNCPEGLLIDLDDNTFVNAASTPEAARSQTDLRLPPSSASTVITGFPVIGYGHPYRGHAASASASTHNLVSQPIYLSPLQVVSMTHNQGQVNSTPHVWAPLHTVPAENRWGYDSETDDELPEYEVSSLGGRNVPQLLTCRFRDRSIGLNSRYHSRLKTSRLCHHHHI